MEAFETKEFLTFVLHTAEDMEAQRQQDLEDQQHEQQQQQQFDHEQEEIEERKLPPPPLTHQTSEHEGGGTRRRSTAGKEIETAFRVFKQSLMETVGAKNWKALFGEDIHKTQNPEIEKALQRLTDIHQLYNGMSRSLAQYVHAMKGLISAEEQIGKFFVFHGVTEENEQIREEMQAFGEKHKQFIHSWQELHQGYSTFHDHVNTFLTKAIDDCFETAKKQQSFRLEYDAYYAKLTSLQSKVTSEPNQKLTQEIEMAKEQFEEAKLHYQEICSQLISKVEVLYELKIGNLKEQFDKLKIVNKTQFSLLLAVNENSNPTRTQTETKGKVEEIFT